VVMCCLSEEVTTKCWSIQHNLSKEEKAAATELRKQHDSVQLSLFDSLEAEELTRGHQKRMNSGLAHLTLSNCGKHFLQVLSHHSYPFKPD
jgi:hypothetical protein